MTRGTYRIVSLGALWSILASSPSAMGQDEPPPVSVRTVVDTLVGAVGGVAVDRLGVIYVATFGNDVYRVMPDGRVTRFATGLYGASGNAIDSRGRLLQSNFYGNSVSRIDREGRVELVATGLRGPVGIAVDSLDAMVVANCRANTLSRVTPDGVVSTFAASPLFQCPNGITRGPDGTYYVVNFTGPKLLAVSPEGAVRELADIPGGGNGHVTMARGDLYVTSFQGQRIYRVTLDGRVSLLAGTGQIGETDGVGPEASFSWPNGIAAGPAGDRLYVNDFRNRFLPTVEAPPVPVSSVRQITLPGLGRMMMAALRAGGVDSLRAVHAAWKRDPSTATAYTEVEVNALGYRLLQAGQVPAAILTFQLNVQAYPNSFNTYDSLAEAYMTAGDNTQAIRFYRESLRRNPANQNAIDKLRELGAPG